MENLLNNPMLQSSLLPLLISLIVAGVVGFSSAKGQRFAAIAVAISALATIIVISGLSFPPKATSQKLPYLIMAGAIIGLLVDALNIKGWSYKLVSLIIPLGMVGWLFGARFNSMDLVGGFYLIVITLLAILTLWQGDNQRNRIDSGLKLLFISGGLGAILLIGSSAMLAQTAFGLMAAIGGLLLWNWPKFRFNIGASILFPIVAILSAMAAQGLFFTKASGIALLLLMPLLLIDLIMPRIPLLNRAATPMTRALSLGAIGVMILPVAIGSALLLTETSGYGY
ncbi:hypothetical protein [Amphritea balenae]|uniref:Uncharacterized protein n=1 Tax=Amphritea balenae TaxID=452629 RepID=A0A3P1SRX5_9GAMM|nr:hypothetical protein [Amphritea balenae]RRC99395.1 hypothetical protein EHS89_11175 [Amphritea balenae]GGK71334.1 hypothetical protein GCM10007941_21830 [Amphritea balenae]